MSPTSDPTPTDRVQRTLKRLGFNACVLQKIHDGRVTLFCPEADRNDHSMIQVAIRFIPGIESVMFAKNSETKDQS
ncbi:hypothetical protein [Neorhodopirellula lusitana]|uniref:hypothetical protein n=1 Tax=Neorhodopirellula lusitana TaxID=445327 RepID=UPI00384DD9AE